MWCVYILKSEKTGRFYVGHTNDLDRRVLEHNSGQTISTKAGGPWTLAYSEAFDTKAEAYGRERRIKSWKSHRSIQELIENG